MSPGSSRSDLEEEGRGRRGAYINDKAALVQHIRLHPYKTGKICCCR